MSLFLKECKVILKSPAIFIYIFFLCLFFFMRYIGDIHTNLNGDVHRPSFYTVPSDGDISVWENDFSMSKKDHPYGRFFTVPVDDNIVIRTGIYDLFNNYLTNVYWVNRWNGSAEISLSDRQQTQIYDVLVKLCGVEFIEEVMNNPMLTEAEHFGGIVRHMNLYELINDTVFDIGIDEYYRQIRQAGKIIGYQNHYNILPGAFAVYGFIGRTATFEEAFEVYNREMVDKYFTQDGVSGGLARVFVGHISTISLLLGGIVSIFYLLRDKKHNEVLAGKSISSRKLFIAKYAAVNTALLLPILLLAIVATIHAGWIATTYSAPRFDLFAFFRVSLLWVLPTNMFVTAFAMFITAATNSPIAAIVLAPLWFVQTSTVTGAFGLNRMFIIFGSEFSLDFYNIVRNEIILNRLFYTGISLILVCITIGLYHLKRGGKWNVQNLWRGLYKKS